MRRSLDALLEDVNDATRWATEAITHEDLGGAAMAALGRALDARGVLYGLRGGDPLAAFAGEEPLVASFPEYAARFASRDPMHPALAATPSRVVRVSAIRGWKDFFRTPGYAQFNARLEIGHILHVRITEVPHLARGMAAIAFFRRPRAGDFGDAEVGLARRAVPAFEAAARRAARALRTGAVIGALAAIVERADPRPHLAFDPEGTLLWASRAAEALLETRRGLPEPLVDAVRRLGALALGNDPAAPLLFSVPVAFGRAAPVSADLRIVRAASGFLVIADLRAPEVAPSLAALAARHGLTVAETEVLAALARGRSNAEIARERCVSLATVRTHVGRVLGKLGVSSRTQAALLARQNQPS